MLACFAWAEARNEPQEVQQAVLEVILNRLISKDFPNTVHDVIYRSELHRAVASMERVDEPDLMQYQAVTAAMYGPYLLPMDVLIYSNEPTKGKIWGEIGNYVSYIQGDFYPLIENRLVSRLLSKSFSEGYHGFLIAFLSALIFPEPV